MCQYSEIMASIVDPFIGSVVAVTILSHYISVCCHSCEPSFLGGDLELDAVLWCQKQVVRPYPWSDGPC